MANYCYYKVIVKGKKNACYAFYGSMPVYDDIEIQEESGTDDKYTIRFEGNCKWHVDRYCEPWDGGFPVVLPDDADEAFSVAVEKYSYRTVRERSKMFEVEVLCNSADEGYDPEEGPWEIFEHYINGEEIDDECPDVLDIYYDLIHPFRCQTWIFTNGSPEDDYYDCTISNPTNIPMPYNLELLPYNFIKNLKKIDNIPDLIDALSCLYEYENDEWCDLSEWLRDKVEKFSDLKSIKISTVIFDSGLNANRKLTGTEITMEYFFESKRKSTKRKRVELDME